MAPITGSVERSADGLIVWRAHTGAALGPVAFDAHNLGLGVDAADPSCVLTVVADDSDRDSGATCFTDPGFLTALVDAPTGATLPQPQLVDEIARAATIHAVSRFHLGDLDPGIVTLDEAHAAALCGDMDGARGRYLMATSSMEEVLDDLAENGGESIAEELEVAVAQCPAMDPENAIATVASAIVDGQDARWSEMVLSIHQEELATTFSPPPPNAAGDFLDLSLLPPRLMRFTGPDEHDLALRMIGDDTVEASAVVRDAIYTSSSEAAGLFVIAVERATGELVSSAPCEASGMRMVALLWLAEHELDDLHFLMVTLDVPLDEVSARPLDVRLAQVDRACRHAWTNHRRGRAILTLVNSATAPELVDAAGHAVAHCRQQADDWAANARIELEDILLHLQSPDHQKLVADFREGVLRLQELVAGDFAPDSPIRPTLAELHAETGW
ncbi:hypothetical protein GIY30_02215 [Gordonia sp. HNM0687]|uniref:Uncharacterized protein n=1 Tax=Gordonia mangrovi TaxID=2665643 RepID=A0A6L7GN77_9ACTN|nr:hypothetical protein [Gordonia mangrovi]MXP20185.1 hypothetical protein [Gordonia mangrovi]UVF79208.1 hypothetical protein NWF22_05025 [Gordonia mangrovi]